MPPEYTADQIEEALRQDPIADAERIVGQGWKDDESVGWLGMDLQKRKSEALGRMLTTTGDTTFSMSVEEYASALDRFGFHEVYREPFRARDHDECIYIHFRSVLLLKWDTYRGGRNSASVYYNWIPRDRSRIGLTSSGHLEICDAQALYEYDRLLAERRCCEYESEAWKKADAAHEAFANQAAIAGHLVWCGYHDAREALKHKLERLEANGQFADPWKADPRPWLCHHGDDLGGTFSGRADSLIQARLAKLPPEVKKTVGVSIES